jgi:glutathione synthase/RimK-type ligase-like ATP-grasp enzyme
VHDWEPYRQIEAALQETEESIARQPANLQLRFDRAQLLTRVGRLQDAKKAYIDILLQDVNHLSSYINLGVVLTELGFYKAARKVYHEVIRRFPHDPTAKLNLAYVLYQLRALKDSRALYETVLTMVPDHGKARYGFSDLLLEMGDHEAAFEQRRRAFVNQPWTMSPYRGDQEPVRLLLLGSPRGGNAPIQKLLDSTVFLSAATYTDFYTESVPLPPHHVVINLVGDADLCGASLDAAERMLEKISAPVINAPSRVRLTGRAENAQLLKGLEGVVTPQIVNLSRDVMSGPDAAAALERSDLRFPVLLRTPGFHGGKHFAKVERAEDLAAAVAGLPGDELTVIQFLDARSADGKIRKYRAMMIDGKLYPVHKAVSERWMVHYFSAQMGNSPEHRAEDAAYLADMPSVLGPAAMQALQRIEAALGLDYAGADFSLGPNGEVLLFEANATMMVPKPEKGPEWDYRRRPVDRIYAAVRDMILKRAGKTDSSGAQPA